MRHEKIFKRADGTQFLLSVDFFISEYSENYGANYKINLSFKDKGKRKWNEVPMNMNEWKFRELSMDKRREYLERNILNYLTEDEIIEAKLELWDKLKPE